MILIGLGANLPSKYGTPAQTLVKAMDAMKEAGIDIVDQSRIWLSAPVHLTTHPWYANAVINIKTDLFPAPLLALLNDIEAEFGRARTYRNAPRVLDLDILTYKDHSLNTLDLVVPHPRMHIRAFVLRPLEDFTTNWTHPTLGESLSTLIEALDPAQEVVPLKEGEEYRLAG